MRTPKLITALDSQVITATSNPIDIREAKKVSILFIRTANAGGSSVMTVTGCIEDDATTGTFVSLNNLIDDVTNTNAQTLTRVASSTISAANGAKFYALDLEKFGYKFIKVSATRVTDGTNTVKVLVEY
jgi:hypothetical protein